MEISYSGTEKLIQQPLSYCENPKILYDLQKLTLYAKREDIAQVVNFLAASNDCSFTGWIRANNDWVKQGLSSNAAVEINRQGNGALKAESFLRLYAYRRHLEIPDAEGKNLKDEDTFWKHHEIIRVSSPMHMVFGTVKALLFEVDFANEFIDNQKIVRKSEDFLAMTSGLLRWLKSNFVSWRGSRCFDNLEEHIRVFGDRFTKNITC